MRTVTENQLNRLLSLGYDGLGIIQHEYKDSYKFLGIHYIACGRWFGEMPCPSYEMAAEWLRDNKGLSMEIHCLGVADYMWELYKIGKYESYKIYACPITVTYKNYDEAISACLDSALDYLEEINKK